jgi:RNA polymerase sigma-70 factor (ECF subfamily)
MRKKDFGPLFETHAQALFAFLVYHSGDRALSEDILSDTFERALRARRRFDADRGSAKSWLFSIALNRLRDVQRRTATESRAIGQYVDQAPREPGFEDQVLDEDEVRQALHALPANEREALALRFGGDLTVPEIARLLDEPLTRVEGRVYRGLSKLRSQYRG